MPPTASLRRPPALRPGDRVAVIAPSGPVPADRLETGLAALRFAGLDPVVQASAHDDGSFRGYLAGTDAQRSGELVDCLLDDSVRGIVFARGGYGAQRTIESIDWTRFADVAPKVLVGYSDVTAILEAVAVKLGWASLLGPMVAAVDEAGHYSWGSLLRALMTPERALDLVFPAPLTVVGGRATGVTMGGNLAMLVSSLGTGTSWKPHDGLLMLEDVDENSYKVDRMLTQLRRSGYLDGVVGIVGGTWMGCGGEDGVEHVLRERLEPLGVPLLLRADFGHGGRVQTVPIGVAAELDADAGRVTFAEPPLVPTA